MLDDSMEDSCQSSDLCRSHFPRNKRPLDNGGLELGVLEDRASSAKRIHFLCENREKLKVPNGCADASDALTKMTEDADRGIPGLDISTTLCLTSEMSKDNPHILNLSRSENGSHSLQNKSVRENYLKENADETCNLPMDLSKGCKIPPTVGGNSGTDVREATNCNGNGFSHLTDERTIEELEEELRNEETMLVLLKKIRQNQLFHRLIKDSVDSGRLMGISAPSMSGRPPLVPGLQPLSNTREIGNRVPNEPSRPLPSPAGQPPMQKTQGSPPSSTVPSHSSAAFVPATSAYSVPSSATALQTSQRPQASAHSKPFPASSHAQPDQDQPTGAQSQAAAKVALRKQLEKTLLQIPPPKPPPPEMNFIPNVGNGDFAVLLGLEEAVKCIFDGDARARGEPVSEVKYVFNPFQCVQCHTDFTPVWKRDKPGSKNVICERCVTNNQKWALKQEHTNRLKSAFVKALQQEQEIEQSLFAQSVVSVSLPHAVGSSPHSSSSLPKSSSSSTQRSGLETPQLSSRHHHHYHRQLQQQQQHQQQQLQPLLSPRQSTTLWTPPALSGVVGLSPTFDPRLMFPFHQPQGSSKSSLDLQRQYLLDLFPRRSHMDGPVLWRT